MTADGPALDLSGARVAVLVRYGGVQAAAPQLRVGAAIAFAVLDILHRDVLLGAARRVDDEDGGLDRIRPGWL